MWFLMELKILIFESPYSLILRTQGNSVTLAPFKMLFIKSSDTDTNPFVVISMFLILDVLYNLKMEV